MVRISKNRLRETVLLKIYDLFFEVVSRSNERNTFKVITEELLSPTEKIMLAKRLAIIYLLIKQVEITIISETLKVSTNTIYRYKGLCEKKESDLVNLIRKMLFKEKALNFLDDLLADWLIHPELYKSHYRLRYEHERAKQRRKVI